MDRQADRQIDRYANNCLDRYTHRKKNIWYPPLAYKSLKNVPKSQGPQRQYLVPKVKNTKQAVWQEAREGVLIVVLFPF